jgi:hypothetical protein
MIYNQFDYFDYDAKVSQILGFSLGNLGFSETHCLIESMTQSNASDILDSDKNDNTINGMILKCPSGLIGSAVDFGVTTVFEDQRTCSHKGST